MCSWRFSGSDILTRSSGGVHTSGQGTTGDMVRTVLGGGPVAKQAGSSVTSFSRSSSASTVGSTKAIDPRCTNLMIYHLQSMASPDVVSEEATISFSTVRYTLRPAKSFVLTVFMCSG
jgi:hypothetical protein